MHNFANEDSHTNILGTDNSTSGGHDTIFDKQHFTTGTLDRLEFILVLVYNDIHCDIDANKKKVGVLVLGDFGSFDGTKSTSNGHSLSDSCGVRNRPLGQFNEIKFESDPS